MAKYMRAPAAQWGCNFHTLRAARPAHQCGFLAVSCSFCHSFSSAAPVRPPTVELLAACSESAARQGAPSGL